MTQQNQSPVVTDEARSAIQDAATFLTAIARSSSMGKRACQEAESHALALEAALSSGVRDALEWYREQAAAARRFMADKEANADALLAILTALSLDGGRRAEAAIEPTQAPERDVFDMLAHLRRQREWSGNTFGPGPRTLGVIDHIRKELREIEADPTDITEWIDVVILALDGAWRAGYQPQEIIDAMVAKQTKNEARQWPDWRTMPTDQAIEHDRSSDAQPAPAPAELEEDAGEWPTMDEILAPFPELDAHIIRMYHTGKIGSLIEWNHFLDALRSAIHPERER